MKAKFAIFLLMVSISSYSQSFEFGFGLGTGSNYIVENADKTVNVNYKMPASVYTDLKYTPKNSNIGILLRYQYTNTSVKGQKWFKRNQVLDAIVNDNSLFLLVEYIKRTKRKLRFGGNFGIGYTKQVIDFISEKYSAENTMPSINFSGILEYRLNSKLGIKLQPSLQFFDPINGLKIKHYNFAREDIGFLVLLGVSYKL